MNFKPNTRCLFNHKLRINFYGKTAARWFVNTSYGFNK